MRHVVQLLCLAATPGCVIDELATADVGDAPWCEGVDTWPVDDAELETTLVKLIGELRRQGATCGDQRHYPVPVPEVDPHLHCAARRHATWLATHDTLGHTGEAGSSPLSRANLALYGGVPRYELLAANYARAGATLEALLAEPAHCRALLNRRVTDVGVGHSHSAEGDETRWVIVLGEPR